MQAINGLVACGDLKPELIISLLARELQLIDHRRTVEDDKALEIHIKIGEAVAKITKNLGEMTPAFKNQLLNPFLGQMNHPDPLVRASSLSNIGEVCKNLRFSLGPIVEEVRVHIKFLSFTPARFHCLQLLDTPVPWPQHEV